MDAIKAIKERRSIRSFKEEPIPKEIIEDIIDAARLAPTANNLQPWVFVAVTDEKMRKRLAGITDYGKFIADSPLCIVVFCEDTKYYLEDGSAATENVLLVAKAYGIGSCWVAGDKKRYADEIRKLLEVPEGHKLVSLIALGYPNGEGKAYGKKSLAQVLHWERYGAT